MNKLINIKTGGRESKFELLRLLSMLMVLNLHSFHGYDYGSGIMQGLDWFRESTSICAVNVFIMISGYFGIKWKFRSFFNLIFQLLFYSFAVYGVCVALGIFSFEMSSFLSCFKATNSSWGFITCYLGIYLMAPLLNTFVQQSSSRELFIYLLCLFMGCNFLIPAYGGILNYFLVYLIGGWMKKSQAVQTFKLPAVKCYWTVTLLIFVLSYSLYRYLHFDAVRMCTFFLGYSYNSPFIILQDMSLFLVFGRIQLQSRFVNWCAASCFSIFLIHMHPAIKHIGYYHFTESLYALPFLEHAGILILLVAGIFMGSILIDKIRIYLSTFVYNLICSFYRRLPYGWADTCIFEKLE